MYCKFLEQTCELSPVLYPHRPGSHQLSLGHPPFSSLADFIILDLDISKVWRAGSFSNPVAEA